MRRRVTVSLLTGVIALLVIIGSLGFVKFVHDSLWAQSVDAILEVTAQGQNALDTFFQKDLDTLDLFVDELREQSPDNKQRVEEKIQLFNQNDDGAVYLIVNLQTGEVHRNDGSQGLVITQDQMEEVKSHAERGVLRPFLDEVPGVNMTGVYELFTFADGTPALARKSRPVQQVADQFSLSFYENSGFSYVVDTDGAIVVRSSHRNSNRTIANIYDLVEHEGNDAELVASFRAALDGERRGVALFTYLDEEYVFCYTPLESTDGWDLVSVVPNNVVMKQTNDVLQSTFFLCAAIVAGLLIILIVFWQTSKEHHKQIEHIAYYDKLTGLYSPAKFELEGNRVLKNLRERASRTHDGIMIGYLNIADFKLINDVDGYQRGDEVLCEVSSLLKTSCEPDGFAGRMTADHFVVLVPYHNEDEAIARIRAVVEQIHTIVAAGKRLVMHVGLCSSSEAPEVQNVNELADRARIAKTEGRHSGQTVCVFNNSMRETMLRRAELERAMEGALERGEFFPLIQPKFSPDGTRVLGGEALVRWKRSDEDIVRPDEFIPLFEQNGFIVKLDEFMFESVCRMLRTRLDAGLPVVPISVNISRLHLHRSSFVSTYVSIKNRYCIPDELAELELTESMVLEDLDNAIAVINELRTAGFRCSIDDFGSGQSSLNALKDLPADVLKLDRAFLLERDHSEKEEVVVRTVIDMARKLHMRTVMEGVETEDQLAFIKTTTCDMIQGFVFSRPISQDEFNHLLDANAEPSL